MSNVQRSSDLKEGFAQKAIMSGIGALVCLSLAESSSLISPPA